MLSSQANRPRAAAVIFSILSWLVLPGSGHGQVPTTPGTLNPNAVSQLMSRGAGTDNGFKSLVVPVNFQSGVPLDDNGDSHGKYPGQTKLPWFDSIQKTARVHFNQNAWQAGYAPYDLPFENPIAAFGAEAGGSDLYVGQTYSFGAYAGGMLFGSISGVSDDVVNDLKHKVVRISAYRKADFVAGAVNVAPYVQVEVSIPRWDIPDDAAAWADFVRAGFTTTVQVADLSTTVRMLDDANTTFTGYYDPYTVGPWNTRASTPAPYLLTHKASSSDYYYVVEARGFFLEGNTMMCSVGDGYYTLPAYSPLYCLDFDPRPAWRASFLGQPHFESEMLPPAYQGKSLQDLIAIKTPVNVPVGLDPADCTGLDASPDLRRHPVLDQLVSDLGNDPLALANFVLNEIELTDSIALNGGGSYGPSFNGGGINRGALDVYLEGQGSPAEQCELLVYLLRQAGVPAAYLFPSNNGIKMLDSELSRLLHLQLVGANDTPDTGPAGTPQLVPVNYPWVAAYVGGKWVHLFPWLKDTEVQEGRDLYPLLPDNYNNALKWTRAYLYNDPAILSLGSPTDPPSVLFPRFLEQSLQANHPDVSSDDVGLKIQDRRHYYTDWADFPVPFSVDNKALTRANLGVDPKMFDTVQVSVSSLANPAKLISTGTMRMADVLHRRLTFRHEKTGTNQHNLIMSLTSYRSDATATTSFGYSDSTWLNKQVLTLPLDASDDQLKVEIKYLRQREAPYSARIYPASFLVNFYNQEFDDSRLLFKGDTAALCFDVGRVTKRMVDLQAQEFMAMEAQLAANPAATVDVDVLQGIPAQLLGLSYYRRSDEARATSELLNKVKTVGAYSRGLSTLHALRVGGVLPNNGDITLSRPELDIFNSEIATVGNQTAHPDSGMPGGSGAQDFWAMFILEGSAQEHASIDAFYNQTDAVSTVRLLQIAQARATADTSKPGIVELNTTNYQAQGQTAYNGTNLQDSDPNIWSVVAANFSTTSQPKGVAWMTPGAVQNDAASYKGVAALTENLDAGSSAAVIGVDQNGGTGEYFSTGMLSLANAPNLNLTMGLNGSYTLTLNSGSPAAMPDQISNFQWQQIFNGLASGTLTPDPFTTQLLGRAPGQYGIDATGDLSAYAQYSENLGNLGAPGFPPVQGDWIADPVNVTTGEFYIDAVDLRLNGTFPLELRRNYLSQSYTNSAYGYCWKTNYMPYLIVSATASTITAAEADGSVIIYRQTNGNPNVWMPQAADNPQMCNFVRGRIGGTNNFFNSSITKATDASGQVSYTLRSVDGSIRTFTMLSFAGNGLTRARPYLTRWQDHRGNYFLFSYGQQPSSPDYGQVRRIAGNDGNYLGFYYDPYGHIVEAYTGDGRHVYYDYDSFGDLIAVTLPDGAETQYTYGHSTQQLAGKSVPCSDHLIVRETKPEGNLLENTYDAQRRVIEQRATVDINHPGTPVRNATFVYAPSSAGGPAAGYTTVTDAYGKVTRYDYADGQITKITDPLNQTEQSDWYATSDTSAGAYPRSLKRHVDKRGLAVTYQYDASGNVVQSVATGDLTGDGFPDTATSTATYNSLNLPTQTSDATGHQKRFYYEDTNYPYLPTRIESWSSGTLVSQEKNEYTQVGAGAFSCFGLLLRHHAAFNTADEAIVEWGYDAQGRVTSKTSYTGTSDPAVVLNFIYNLRGEVVQLRDAVGGHSDFSYDGLGRLIGQEVHDETGLLVSWNYAYFDGNGLLTWSDGPRYNPEDYVWRKYDGAGRPLEVERWRSRARADGQGVEAVPGDAQLAGTFYQHDLFGNLVQTIDARHNTTQADYDAIGQLKTRRRYGGDAASGTLLSTETFGYEPGGLVSTSTGVLGGTTNLFYTAGGQTRRQENPDGTALEWRYGLDGRLQREVFSNGSYRDTTYDDVALKTTHTLYAAGGGTVLAVTSEAHDHRRNLIQRTDAEGNVFTQTFDGLNRIKTTTGPAATANSARQTSTYIYDAAGRLQKVTNGLGEETDTSLDVLGRPTLVVVRNSAGTVINTTSYVYSSDHQSVTVTAGTSTNALRTTTYTDNNGAPVLTRHEDSGQFARVDYDEAGNMTTSVDELGQSTVYGYDASAHLSLQTLPDGAQTRFVNDAAGNLLQRQMPGGTTWKATYDPAGRQLTQELDAPGGGSATRQYAYSYYTSGAFVGKLQTTTAPGGVSHQTTYDDFLRVASVISSGSLPTQSLRRQYTYDRRNLLLSVAQSSPAGGPSAPPATLVSRLYDGYGQLSDEQVAMGGSTFSHLRQTWDAAGRRVTLGRGNQVAAQGNGAGAARSFGYRADGLLTSLGWTGAGGAAQGATYGYLDNGLLASRAGPWRTWSVVQRDGRDRPTVITTSTVLPNWGEPLRELLSWRANNTQDYYDAIRNLGPAASGNNWSEARAYSYNARGELLNEGFAPVMGQQAALSYGFDFGVNPGDLGRRTSAMANGWQSLSATQTDAFGRVSQEGRVLQNATITAQGSAPLAGRISLAVDGAPVAPASVNFNVATGAWSAPLTLTAGGTTHTLSVTAVADALAFKPSAVGTATSTFTVGTAGGAGSDSLGRSYDGAGNVLSRGLGAGAGAGTQTLVWDALDRLASVQARDANNAGYNWQAVYDGLGRRLRTIYTPVSSGGSVQSAQATTTDSWFDPQVEFLEVAVAQNGGVRQWLLYGPDLDGRYGSAQGMGGLEASVQESDGASTGYVLDQYGHVEARVEGVTLTWQPVRFGGYGALPGTGTIPAFVGATPFSQSVGWHGRRLDPTGFYWLGARHYDPLDGRFLSADPLGHGASTDLYTYAIGDPVNYFDASGRFGKAVMDHQNDQGFWGLYGLYTSIADTGNMLSFGNWSQPADDQHVTAEQMFYQWVYGLGPDSRVFGDDSKMGQQMKRSDYVLDAVYNVAMMAHLNDALPEGAGFPTSIYTGRSIAGMSQYLYPLDFVSDVLVDNDARAYQGSISGRSTFTGFADDAHTMVNVTVTLADKSSASSATHAPDGNGNYNPPVMNNNPFGPDGQMRTITVNYELHFTVPIVRPTPSPPPGMTQNGL